MRLPIARWTLFAVLAASAWGCSGTDAAGPQDAGIPGEDAAAGDASASEPDASAPTATCGNDLEEPGEQCDDGNRSSADGCSAACTTEHLLQVNPVHESFGRMDLAVVASGEAVVTWQAGTSPGAWMGSGTTGQGAALVAPSALTSRQVGNGTLLQLYAAGPHAYALAHAADAAGTQLLFARSDDGGKLWSPAQALATVTASGYAADLVARGDAVHLVYRTGAHEIFYLSSGDAGATWSSPKLVRASDNVPRCPALAVDEQGKLVVVATEGTPTRVNVFRSSDGGQTWSAGACLNPKADGTCPVGMGLGVQYGAGHYHALFLQLPTFSVQHGTSVDGAAWQVTDPGCDDALASWRIDAAGRVHLAWDHEEDSGAHSAHYRSFDGTSWGAPVLLDPDGGRGAAYTLPSVAVAGERVHVVWRGRDPTNVSATGARLKWAQSRDSGASFDPELTVDQGPGHDINY
ncbi:MAG: exo-alpha-sialidase, partial [Deltaproteobacteria bacterium]|nr:exo-alpha-sialidase [Deltaproteobacteria bacterium]